jgi:hypothetical protein
MTGIVPPVSGLSLDRLTGDSPLSRLAAEINACSPEFSVDHDEDDDQSLVLESFHQTGPSLPPSQNIYKECTPTPVSPVTLASPETLQSVPSPRSAQLSKAQLLHKMLASSTIGSLDYKIVDCSSPVSKLEVLRARTKILRRAGSMKIAETKKSLEDSSRSIRSSPILSPAGSGWDESTVETVSSRTWTETPPLYGSQSQQTGIPLQVLLQDPNKRKNRSKMDDDFEQSKAMNHIMQENEILKLKVELLEKKNSLGFERDLVSLREILHEKSKTRKANRTGANLLIVCVVFASLFVWEHHTGRMGDSTLFDGLMGTIRKEVDVKFDHIQDEPFVRVEKDEASISSEDNSNVSIVEPKLGPLNRLFINMENDQAAVWLKLKKHGKV